MAHIAVVNILVVFGAFCAALLAASYNSQVEQWKVSASAVVCREVLAALGRPLATCLER